MISLPRLSVAGNSKLASISTVIFLNIAKVQPFVVSVKVSMTQSAVGRIPQH